MNGLCKEIIKELEEARFYNALSKIKELKNEDGITNNLLMLLYFTYDLMFFMSQHQHTDGRKYKRLRDYYFYKLTNEIKGKDVVYLNLSIFLDKNFTSLDRFVWFDKSKEIFHLIDKALKINPDNQEAQFYQFQYADETNKCIELLLKGDFEKSVVDKYLSTIPLSSNFKINIKEKSKLLEEIYQPEGDKLKWFARHYYYSDQYEKLYKLFKENSELKDSSFNIDIGRVCMELGKYDEALILFKEQEEIKPNYIDMAKCYEKLNNTDEAIKNYKKACIHFSSGRWTDAPDALLRLKAYKELKEALEQSEENNKPLLQDSIELYQAKLLHFVGKYKESIQKLDEILPLLKRSHQEKPEEWYWYQALNNYEIVLDRMQRDYESILNKQDFNLDSSWGIDYSHYASYQNYQQHMEKLNLRFNYKHTKQEAELKKKE